MKKKKPLVFMDLSIFKRPPDRLVIELFYDDVPKTAENFRALCTGDKGIGKDTQKLLHYKGTKFFYFSDCAALGGDFENNDGTGGESIYGGTFQAERSPWRCSGPGILMTLSQGAPDATGSQFVLCYRHSTDLEGDNTVFGRVIKGMDTVLRLEMMGRGTSVEIVDCGELSGDYVPESDSYKPSPLAAWRQKREEMATAFLHNFLSRKVIDREATSEKPSSNPDGTSESHESNAEKSELTNSSSYPHHRSDDTLKPRGARIVYVKRNSGSTISEDENVTKSDKVVETVLDTRREWDGSSILVVEDNIVTESDKEPCNVLKRALNINEKNAAAYYYLLPVVEEENDTVMGFEFDKELKFEILRSPHGVITSVLDTCESNAEKKVAADKELTNSSSNDTSKSRDVRIIDLVNQSKKRSGSPISSEEDENNTVTTESDKGFLHDVIMPSLDTRESNAEKKVADDKKRKSLEVWPAIAGAVILGAAAYFRHQKSGVVYREQHRNR
ncbi:putative peptidylprolyl isomerase [Helianthus annuus]|nr:putative peptidylprolyl isomerase [Helianthus annuus]